jgi:peptidoglycan/LPS O-acetylase OafA/YrhL
MAALVPWLLWSGQSVTMSNLLPEMFFYQNYLEGLWGTNWSLAVEEHFYLLLPLTLLLLAGGRANAEQPFRRLPWFFVGLATACLVFRTWNAPAPFNFYTHQKPTHLRLDGLFFGALLAYKHVYHHARMVHFCRRYRWLLLAAGVAGFVPAFFFPLQTSMYMQVFGFIPQWLGAGALVCFVLGRTSTPGRSARVLAAIGRTSYATYLWHFWIGYYWLPGLAKLLGIPLNWAWLTIGYYASTVGAGFLFTALIERPFLRWRDRLVPAAPRAQTLHEPEATALLHGSQAAD